MYYESSSKTWSNNNMKIYVDIDNTICYTNGMNYIDAKPNYNNIGKINKF